MCVVLGQNLLSGTYKPVTAFHGLYAGSLDARETGAVREEAKGTTYNLKPCAYIKCLIAYVMVYDEDSGFGEGRHYNLKTSYETSPQFISQH